MRKKKEFNAHPYAYHEELECVVESVTNLGMGICRDNGWVIMVPFVLVGEKVRLKIFKNNKNYSEADLVEVLESSSHRVEAKCPIFKVCGGCQYQHIDYQEQLAIKQGQVKELFSRLGGIEMDVAFPLGSPEVYAYRSKLTPHYQMPRDGSYHAIGFLKFGKRQELVDVPACPIATRKINEKLVEVRRDLQAAAKNVQKKKKGGTILLRDTGNEVITDPKETGLEKVGDTLFQFKAGEFFQNNPHILPSLVDYVLAEARERSDVQYLLDAYCGVGLFALSARKSFDQILGIEISDQSVTWARKNAELNQAENCKFLLGSAEEIFNGVEFAAERTAVIIDPPRKGCDIPFLEQLVSYGPKKLVYVSCDPATQARDAQYLIEHGYILKKIQPFDLFPHTRHCESVATFDKA